MKAEARKAYEKLRKLNIAVQCGDEWKERTGEDRGHFWIWCEGVTDETEEHIDYYGIFWGSDQLNEILDQHGLWFEWQNPGVANVYSID